MPFVDSVFVDSSGPCWARDRGGSWLNAGLGAQCPPPQHQAISKAVGAEVEKKHHSKREKESLIIGNLKCMGKQISAKVLTHI